MRSNRCFVTILPRWAYKTTREMHAFELMLCNNTASINIPRMGFTKQQTCEMHDDRLMFVTILQRWACAVTKILEDQTKIRVRVFEVLFKGVSIRFRRRLIEIRSKTQTQVFVRASKIFVWEHKIMTKDHSIPEKPTHIASSRATICI